MAKTTDDHSRGLRSISEAGNVVLGKVEWLAQDTHGLTSCLRGCMIDTAGKAEWGSLQRGLCDLQPLLAFPGCVPTSAPTPLTSGTSSSSEV